MEKKPKKAPKALTELTAEEMQKVAGGYRWYTPSKGSPRGGSGSN
jgi:hypothetical protein